MRSGARAKDFEMAIQWLVDAGLTYRISRVREAGMPLKFYEDLNAFKLFLLDVGLLGALSEMEPAQMLISNKAMTESKGAFTETTSLPSYYVNRTFTPIIIVGKTLAWR